MKLSAKRRMELINKIDVHVGMNSGFNDLNLWQELAQYFPDCIYLGRAFRVVLCSSEELDREQAITPGHSWSLSLNGIENYLRSGMNYDPIDEPGFWFISGQIEGISLAHIAARLKSENIQLPRLPIKEDEVIMLNLLSSSQPRWLSSWKNLQELK